MYFDLKGQHRVSALRAWLGLHQADLRARPGLQEVVASLVAEVLQTESVAVEAGCARQVDDRQDGRHLNVLSRKTGARKSALVRVRQTAVRLRQ